MKRILVAMIAGIVLTLSACGNTSSAPKASSADTPCSQVFTVGKTLPKPFKGCDGPIAGYGCHIWGTDATGPWTWAKEGQKVQRGQQAMMRAIGRC